MRLKMKSYENLVETDIQEFEETLANANSEWNGIFQEAVNSEITFINEGADYLNEGIASKFMNSIKKFFVNIAGWIKKRYTDLKNFTNKTLTKMKAVFGLIEKFATENEDRIINGAKTGEVTVTIRDWHPQLLNIAEIERVLATLNYSSDEFDSIMKETQEFVDSYFKSDKLVEVKVTQQMAKTAISNAKNSVNIDKVIKKYVDEAEKALKKTEDASKEGARNTKDEQAVIENKDKVEEGKRDILKSSKKASILINLVNRAVVDSHKINVACASMYTGE